MPVDGNHFAANLHAGRGRACHCNAFARARWFAEVRADRIRPKNPPPAFPADQALHQFVWILQVRKSQIAFQNGATAVDFQVHRLVGGERMDFHHGRECALEIFSSSSRHSRAGEKLQPPVEFKRGW
jgi:hypothetical protein